MRPIVRVIAWLKPWYEPVDRGPISPTEALVPSRLNELLVADITYVAVAIGFVYVPAILGRAASWIASWADAEVRLAPAVLQAAIATQQPPTSCTNHSDRGSQYDAERYRAQLEG